MLDSIYHSIRCLTAHRPTLKELIDQLSEVADKWYEIGTHLEVQGSVLDNIQKSHLNTDGGNRCAIELYRYWLNNDLKASWDKIIDAVEQHSKVLADNLRKTHTSMGKGRGRPHPHQSHWRQPLQLFKVCDMN